MKRKTVTGLTEFSVSSFSVVFESTEKSIVEIRAVIEDLLSQNAYLASLTVMSITTEREVIGTNQTMSRYSVTLATFQTERTSNASADREAIQPSG